MKAMIGIVGSKEKKTVSSLLDVILKTAGYKSKIISNKDLEKFISYSQNNAKQIENTNINILEIDNEKIKDVLNNNIELDIVIDIDMTLEKYRKDNHSKDKIKLINTLKDNKLLIVNTDDKSSIELKSKHKSTIMTYGLNGKNNVTASSLDFNIKTKFNLCLQRAIKTIFGGYLDAFEHPIEVDLIGVENLYSTIAAISIALYFDIDLNTIANTLSNIDELKENIKKTDMDSFMIIDCFAESPSDYENMLYSIQNLDYRELIVMNLIEGNKSESDKEIADIIRSWGQGVNLRALVTVVDMSNINKKDYYKHIKKENIDYSVCCELNRAIEHCLLNIEEGDMFLILGNKRNFKTISN